ncbi:UNVERIFIED_CONTAM: protein NUCLEAR FUSION defective [Sesamum calycinum]|uniref:Protein NUCLEAR FUSION defective n=1 Tax=Sesamum calycinum TaxID=2727403 RepID=A0AAW2SBC5_9LAMI
MALQWLTLIATIWLQSINGSNSNFPAYSSELKKLLSISQLQLNNLAFASDAGKLLGWISGLAAAHLPLWLVLIIGSFLGLVGYGVQFLFLANHLFSLSYWHVFLLTVLSGNSICWINTVCYILAIKNFPHDRHFAIGLSTSYVGLSAKIYTDIVDVVSATSPTERAKAFLFLNSLLPLLVCIVSMPLARNIADARKSRKLAGGFFNLFMITIVTGFFAVISSFTSLGSRVLPLVGMVVLLLAPLMTPLAEKVGEKLQKRCLIRVCDEGFGSSSGLSGMESGEIKDQEFCGLEGEEIGAMSMVRRVEFWLYFFVYLLGATLGLVYLNNLGQIAESRGCLRTSSLVSVASAFGFFGRLLPCLLDYFSSSDGGDDGPNVRSVLPAGGQQAGVGTLYQHSRDRRVHWCNHFHIRLDNDGAVWGEEFRGESQHLGVEYPHGVVPFWGLGSAALQERRRRELHGGEVLPNNFLDLGMFVCFGNFVGFDPSFKNQKKYT